MNRPALQCTYLYSVLKSVGDVIYKCERMHGPCGLVIL